MALARHSIAGVVDTTTFSLDVGSPGNNRMVLIAAGAETPGTPWTITSVTVDGKACTFVAKDSYTSGSIQYKHLYYINEAALGASSGSVTVSITDAPGVSEMCTGVVYYDADQSAPIATTRADASNVATMPALTVPADSYAVFFTECGSSQAFSSWGTPLSTIQSQTASTSTAVVGEGYEATEQVGKQYVGTWTSVNRCASVVTYVTQYVSPDPITQVASIDQVVPATISKINGVDPFDVSKISGI